ncbi:tetratricopeptide repeat protein, partial [Planctomycetota bacterium]
MKKLKKRISVKKKPAGIHINLAFVLVNQGVLLDLGIVRTHRNKRSLCRLHQEVLKISNKQQVPEQLGLLFALHRLYGPLRTKYTLTDSSKQSILIFNESGPQGHRSSDYPGLVSYFNRFTRLHFPKSHSDGLGPSETHNTDQLKNEIGNDLVFKGIELQWLYNRRGKRDSNRIITATGELQHKKILLLEATEDKREEIYSALRRLDLKALKAYEVTKKQVRDYIQALQTKIATKIPFNADQCTKEGKETKLAEDPQALHRKIVELVDEALELDILIKPSDWDNRATHWRDLIMSKIVTNLPAANVNAGTETAYDLVSHSLSQISKQYSEIRLLLAAHFTLQGKYEAALKELRAYSDNNFKDALPYILIGSVQFGLMQYDIAIQSYEEAFHRGDRAMAAFGIALMNLYMYNHQEATKWIDKGLRYNSKSRSGRIVNAILLRMDSKYEEALRLSEQLIEENHRDGYAMTQRAWCLFTLKRYLEAFKQSRLLLESKKGPYLQSFSIMAASLCEMKKLNFAKRLIMKALPMMRGDPDTAEMYRRLMHIAYQQGNLREAVRNTVRMYRCSPNDVRPKLWLALGLRRINHSGLAKKFAEISFDSDKCSEYQLAEISNAYIGLEDFKRAANVICLIANQDNLAVALHNISNHSLIHIQMGLSSLLYMRLEGLEKGDWREPITAFKNIHGLM